MPQAPVNERVLSLAGASTDPVKLVVTVFTPEGAGPFPLAVLNHGAPTHGGHPSDEPRYRVSYSADYFLSRGYAVVMPMMRGFGGSEGELPRTGCDLGDLALRNAADIREVVGFMTRQPYVDPTRIVVSGQSFGGWNTLAVGALDLPHVKGLINFAGGMRTSECPNSDAALAEAAGVFGQRTKVPSLWFYGDNGFDPLLTALTGCRSGGHFCRLYAVDNAVVWSRPTPEPPPTKFAKVNDANAVPYLSEKGRAGYRLFLTLRKPRAFALAADGGWDASALGPDPLAYALSHCRQQHPTCQLYAVDNDVVWAGSTTR